MSAATPAPTFLLSLPRSGSTLAQRVIAAHEGVATTSEPWILLPTLALLRERVHGGATWHAMAAGALRDFADELPGGVGDLRAGLRELATTLYARAAAPGAHLFLDKTPSYALVAEELLDVFPDARVIVLWRNPLAVVASIVDTFCGGAWRPDEHSDSLFTGLANLVAVTGRHDPRVYTARYEDLVTGGAPAWRGVMSHLGLELDERALGRFTRVELRGRMGDPDRYASLSDEPLLKWRTTVNNPLRLAWCRRYLGWIGDERLAVMGYDAQELRRQLGAVPVGRTRLAVDARLLASAAARDFVKARAPHRARGPSTSRLLTGRAAAAGAN